MLLVDELLLALKFLLPLELVVVVLPLLLPRHCPCLLLSL